MPQITKISPQKRRKRVNIFIDEKFAFGIDLEILAKYNLQVGQEISQGEIEEIIKEGEFQKAYDKALRFLSFRSRSEKEVKDYLRKKNIGEKTQKMVIKKLERTGLLDDKQFAFWWLDQRINFRPTGRIILRGELRRKGIDEEIINEVLEEKISYSFEHKLALKAAKEKLSSYQKFPSLEFRQKMSAFLARRGFSWEVVKEVVDGFSKKR